MFSRPLCERRKFLHDNMVEVPNRILFSEMKHVTVRLCFGRISQELLLFIFFKLLFEQHTMTCVCVCVRQRASDLAEMITRVIREGLEGLVLKDIKVHCVVFV